ncbi:DNA-directed RNA polymerase subunit alpha [bacterium]|nr:DNA-directed RNA polymerase subunit alpha [bacterium]
MGGIKLSTKAWVKYEEVSKTEGNFTIQPLDKGLGVTLGNSLRRVLLSSLEGHGVLGVKIEGVSHEFSTIPNVVEDVLEIICNLKGVIFKKMTEDDAEVEISVTSKKKVTAADIKCSTGIEILNKNHYLFQVTDKANVSIKVFIGSGIGYQDSQLQNNEDKDVNYIATDTSFSPILKVNHDVEMIRVGKELDHDKLTLNVLTNGVVKPDDAINKAVAIISEHLDIFNRINEEPEIDNSEEKELEDLKVQTILNMSVDELELSARSSNCLKRAGIDKVEQLLEKDMSELVQIKNFGKKSADEINMRLKQYNLALKGEIEEE